MNLSGNERAERESARPADFFLIICLCLIVYANSFFVGWVSDDFHFIAINRSIKSLSNAGSFFTAPNETTASSSAYGGIYRPLRTLWFAIDYLIWGMRPFGFHLANLLLHFISSVLVFLVCMHLLGHRWTSLAAALLFAAHPAQVEAVTWISSRADGMAMVFMLGSFLLFVHARGRKGSSLPVLVGSFAAFILALLSKETAIVLPILLIAYDVSFPRRNEPRRRKQFLQHCVFIGTAAVYFIVRARVLQTVSQTGYWGGSFWVTALTMAKCFLIYLKLIFLPPAVNCMEYVVPLAELPVSFGSIWPAAIFLVFVLGALLLWRLSPIAGFGFAWFLIALSPVSNVFPISMFMAERFLYIPMVGICVAVAAIFEAATKSADPLRRRLLGGSLCAMLLFFGLISIAKNSAWRDPENLWTQTLQLYPDSYRARMGLADTYYKRGQSFEAIKQYSHALRLFRTSQALHDLGNAYRQLGDFDSAIAAYKSALSQNPDSSWTRTSLGIVYLLQRKTDRSIEEFGRALELDKTYPVAHHYLGVALEEKGEIEGALREYRTALYYDPDREDARRRIVEIESQMQSE